MQSSGDLLRFSFRTFLFTVWIVRSIVHGQVQNHYGEEKNEVAVKDDEGLQKSYTDLFNWRTKMPVTDGDLPGLKEMGEGCSKDALFHSSNPHHMSVVNSITNLLMGAGSAKEAIRMAGSLRDKEEVNVNAWLRAVLMASIHRPDLQGLQRPPMIHLLPSLFMNAPAITRMKRQAAYDEQKCIVVDGSRGVDNGVENRLWYFREDVMVNSNHLYWHTTYPKVSQLPEGDRRGELFYFMHHNFLARYHAERLANGLAPVRALNLEVGTVLREGYNPHLTDANSRRNWQPRPPNVHISDTMSHALAFVPSSPFFISVANRTIYQNRLLEGIALRSLVNKFGEEVPIDNVAGINILAIAVESNQFSLNPEYYGYNGIHNDGHTLTSLALDPDERLGLPPGVMGDIATAMRDVIFYPYHVWIDDIFEAHKRTLPPYQLQGGDWPLVWSGVEIKSLGVQSYDLPLNNLQTFFTQKNFDLSLGLDFNRTAAQGPITACVEHLDHRDFQYKLTVERESFVKSSRATVRLFLATRFDENGKRYVLDEQRRRAFILDTFSVTLNVGLNTIVRNSADSFLTMDFPQSYRELEEDPHLVTPYCGCGWPHHLLLPKGTPQGMAFDLFAMVTDGDEDFVPLSDRPQICRPAPIFCGIQGELYPDPRPMNYPFDRQIYKGNNINPYDHGFDEVGGLVTIEEWTSYVPNMAVVPVTVTHVEAFPHGKFDEGHLEGQHTSS